MEPGTKMTARQALEHLIASGAGFQDVRRAMKNRFGVRLDYLGADRVGGKAMARRRRQIAAGKLQVTSCSCGAMLERGNTLGLCSTCLERKWGD